MSGSSWERYIELPCSHTPSRLCSLQLVRFQTTPRDQLYMLVLHTLHVLTLLSRHDSKWRDYLPPVEGEEPRWASLYSTLVPRPTRDIGWQLLHGAVSTGVYLVWFTPIPEACPFCRVRESLAHAYLECTMWQPLFRLLQNLLLRFWLHFSPHTCSFSHTLSMAPRSRETSSSTSSWLWPKLPSITPGGGCWTRGCSATVGPISVPP
ncbi:unnamed protein product [Caretta caretta]